MSNIINQNVQVEITKDSLDETFATVQKQTAEFFSLKERTHTALYGAIASTYVWYRKTNEVPGYLDTKLQSAGISTKSKTREFVKLIRLTFGLTKSKDQTDDEKQSESRFVNRTSTALEVIHREFQATGVTALDTLTVSQFIKDSGGIEKLQALQIEHLRGKGDVESAAKEKIAKAISDGAKEHFGQKPALASFSHLSQLAVSGDFVPLIGRVGADQCVEVLDVLPNNSEIMTQLFNESPGYDVSHLAPGLNFLSELTELAEVVPEGDSHLPVKSGADIRAKTTKMLPNNRQFLFCSADKNGTIFVGPSRCASSVLLEAQPKDPSIFRFDQDLILDTKTRRWFEKNVRKKSLRKLHSFSVVMSADNEKSRAKCLVENDVTNSKQHIYFYAYSGHNLHVLTLNRAQVNWAYECELSDNDLADIAANYFLPYSKTSKSKSRASVLDMKFCAENGWSISYLDSSPQVFKTNLMSSSPGAVEAQSIGKDWCSVISKILELQPTSPIKLKVDPSGVFQLEAESQFATYRFLIPTVTAGSETRNPKYFDTASKVKSTESTSDTTLTDLAA